VRGRPRWQACGKAIDEILSEAELENQISKIDRMETKYWYFKNFFFFDMISEEDYQSLEVRSELVNCVKDAFVYLPGEGQNSVYFLKRGYIKLGAYDEQGKEVIFNVLQPGDIFGSLHQVESHSTGEFAQAMSPVAACEINTHKFIDLLTSRGDLSLHIIKMVGERVNRLERKLISLAFRDARTRVVEFLRDFATEYGRRRGEEIHIDSFLTHQDIGNLTATSRQLVSTTLSELKLAGLLDYDRRTFVIKVPLEQIV
jgi:CRP/FNR family transcriptional regulator, cyclic AMP receptor protein